ncbi:MAG TPA: glutamate-5-semialdehyde dehydrogenase [Roseiflexaceae bacterium]|nr:glutamate-5-semialdehyde dehydrogenase [Roseiflexaceae bacterium]
MLNIVEIGQRARAAGRVLARATTGQKNAALEAIAAALLERAHEIVEANARDLDGGRRAGLSEALLDRMMLSVPRLESIAADVRNVIKLQDPVGETFDHATLPNGLRVHRRRVPLGVVGVIYEARPNVTVDIAALCLKSGNAAILRGGKEIMHSCGVLAAIIRDALADAKLPADAIQVIDDPNRALVGQLLKLDKYVDVIIPRGGGSLHQFCRENATIPVITGGVGVCHVYVDKDADMSKVVPIVRNAKVQRPSVCNALDTVLVHRSVAAQALPDIARDLLDHGVELRMDADALAILHEADIISDKVKPAGDDDFGTEFMALILSGRVVDSMDEALDHIAQYGDHSDAIITENRAAADTFVAAVDSAAVFVNASTRFNDGGQLGLGAEIAVSTQKLHVRGPMALRELTTYKWVVEGDGHVRP